MTLSFATIEDLNKLGDDYRLNAVHDDKSGPGLATLLGLPKRLTIMVQQLAPVPHNNYGNNWDYRGRNVVTQPRTGLKTLKTFVLTHSSDYWNDPDREKPLKPITAAIAKIEVATIQNSGNYYYGSFHKGAVLASVVINGNTYPIIMTFKEAEALFSIQLTQDLELSCQGKTHVFPDPFWILEKQNSDNGHIGRRRFTFESLNQVRSYFGDPKNIETYLKKAVKGKNFATIKTSGISKIYDRIASFAEQDVENDPALFAAFRELASNSHRTIDKVKVSTIFNMMYEKVVSVEEYKKVTKLFGDALFKNTGYLNFETSFREIPAYAGKRKIALKSNATGAFNKLMDDFDFVKDTLDQKKFPKTYKAIFDGEIPTSTFFRKKEQYFLLNDNWELWEKMLTHHRETTLELAKEVSKRTTYEKDLMSYFFFILYELPEYLKKQTGAKWTCSPRLVDSPSELDPPAAGADGVTKKRSALTPTVDNVKRTVEVPYASLGMPGRQTVYCYSHNYSLIKRGLTLNGNVAMSDIEEKLNGKDDYGLMFYTLTGSHEGRGYPTFLIIFENRKGGVFVHFHRTHPCRSKDGDYNPIHNWIRTSYNWMAGNVHKSRIKAQQGDLVFVEMEDASKFISEKTVNNYDNHCFDAPVEFMDAPEGKKKSNILGYFRLANDTLLKHHEHDVITVPAGTFEVRQCRSWEANPAGIWSLRID